MLNMRTESSRRGFCLLAKTEPHTVTIGDRSGKNHKEPQRKKHSGMMLILESLEAVTCWRLAELRFVPEYIPKYLKTNPRGMIDSSIDNTFSLFMLEILEKVDDK